MFVMRRNIANNPREAQGSQVRRTCRGVKECALQEEVELVEVIGCMQPPAPKIIVTN